MAPDRHHHTSKKNQYTVVFVPNEDASKAKNLRFSLWQLAAGAAVFSIMTLALLLLALTYTPLGELFPLSNRGLEKKYNQQITVLTEKMTGLREELTGLRTYNLKLRKAFGENVSDSNKTDISPQHVVSEKRETIQERPAPVLSPIAIADEQPQAVEVHRMQSASHIQQMTSFPAIIPAEGYRTRGFEPEYNHYGLDIAGKTGTLIIAAADGNIVFSGWTYADGFVVILSHANGYMTFYKHNQSLLKTAGAFVRRGEPIATLGSSGTTSSGPHLHFEIWKDGVPVNPSAYLLNYYL